jgi:hypothetical protein
MMEVIVGIFAVTGGIFWILGFAYFVGWFADKCGVNK